jgi:hypothetical protein
MGCINNDSLAMPCEEESRADVQHWRRYCFCLSDLSKMGDLWLVSHVHPTILFVKIFFASDFLLEQHKQKINHNQCLR